MRDWLISLLVWLSAEPAVIDQAPPRAAAAVAAARASMSVEAPAPPSPPQPEKCCSDCGGTGTIVHGDGHRTPCPCPAGCPCKRSKK